jgi:glycosyltransferase involved in cell wall biosynthesis
MAFPVVSVIITSFNYAEYIARTIDSVLSQTYPAIELIVVDDGSTDDSLAIIASFGNRLRYIARANGGEAAACNTGFAASRGTIVMFLDSDDVLYPDAVETVVRHWSADTAKVQFYLDRIDPEGRSLGQRAPNLPFAADDAVPALLRHYAYYPAPPSSGNAYARSLLKKIMPVPERKWRRGVDGYLNALAALHGPIVSVHAAHGGYRIHDRNMSGWNRLDLDKLRSGMLNEIDRETALRHHARLLGELLPEGLALRIPTHVKSRIVSLRLDPAGHPIPGDTLGQLVRDGIRAAWQFPHFSFRKRIAGVLGFRLLSLIPARVLQTKLDPLFRPEKRRLSSWLAAARTISAIVLVPELVRTLASVSI